MGTTLASTLITRARGILQDSDSTSYTWSDADLLSYLDEGQRAIVFLKHNAYVVTETVQLVAGPKQSVKDGIGLIRINCNMGTDGSTRGDAVYYVPYEDMAYNNRGWMSADSSATVEIYTYDPEEPDTFYVYPPQPTSSMGYVEEVYVGLPATLDDTTDAIVLGDIYQTSLLNYALYRAYSREVDATSAQMAEKYYTLYLQSLGLKTAAENTSSPKE